MKRKTGLKRLTRELWRQRCHVTNPSLPPFSSIFFFFTFTIYFYPIFILCVLSFVAVSVLCVDYPFFSVNPTDVTTHVALAHLQSKYAADELSFIDIYIYIFFCLYFKEETNERMNECDILVFWNVIIFFSFSPFLLSALVIADLLLRFAELKIFPIFNSERGIHNFILVTRKRTEKDFDSILRFCSGFCFLIYFCFVLICCLRVISYFKSCWFSAVLWSMFFVCA